MSKRLEDAVKELSAIIKERLLEKGTVSVAVDGNCGGGKSTLAKALLKEINCNLFEMDDFYLPLKERTAERFAEAGGNIDRERFKSEILEPAKNGERILYRAFDCEKQEITRAYEMTPKNIFVTEGSYSCHPDFYDYYDLHIFISVSPEAQRERIIKRGGEKEYDVFSRIWIPWEEEYFKKFNIKEKCEIVYNFD